VSSFEKSTLKVMRAIVQDEWKCHMWGIAQVLSRMRVSHHSKHILCDSNVHVDFPLRSKELYNTMPNEC
jgi:hypothetical protein